MALRLIFLLVISIISTAAVPFNSHNNSLRHIPPAVTGKTSSGSRCPYFPNQPNFYMTKQQTPLRVHITYKDVMQLYDSSHTAAWRKIQTARDGLGKDKKQTITIKEFCSFYGLDYTDTLIHLQLL